MRPRRHRTADEQDAFTRWRKVLYWSPGERKKIKQTSHRYDRRTLDTSEINLGLEELTQEQNMEDVSLTPTLDDIAAHGNRGHVGQIANNKITCRDETSLSVIAGGGTLSYPRVQFCTEYKGEHVLGTMYGCEQPHTYVGPYTHVDVLTDEGDGVKPVEEVRKYILSHGGEKIPGETPEEAELRASIARGLAQAANGEVTFLTLIHDDEEN
jgi:hypothetical protein